MANVQATKIGGNVVYYDDTRQRWIDAIGPNVVKYLEHFVGTPFDGADTPAGWTVTLVEGGSGETTVALVGGSDYGSLLITTDDAENDGANLQLKGEAFKLASTRRAYFGIRCKISDATQSDILVGLCITDTDLLGGMTDGAYFRKADGSTTVSAVLEKDSSETTGTALTMDTSFHIFEIVFNGTAVDFYVDGTAITRLAQTNLPDDEWLTPSIHFLAGAAAAITCEIDWVRAISLGS